MCESSMSCKRCNICILACDFWTIVKRCIIAATCCPKATSPFKDVFYLLSSRLSFLSVHLSSSICTSLKRTSSMSSLLLTLFLFAGCCSGCGVPENVDGCTLAGISETSLVEGELNKQHKVKVLE